MSSVFLRTYWIDVYVTEQDPMGPSRTDPAMSSACLLFVEEM